MINDDFGTSKTEILFPTRIEIFYVFNSDSVTWGLKVYVGIERKGGGIDTPPLPVGRTSL